MSAEPDHQGPHFAPGFVAALPLFAAYELGLASESSLHGPQGHNGAELLLTLPLRGLGEAAPFARWAALLVAAFFAGQWIHRHGFEARRLVPRAALEGLALALVLGPVLYLLIGLFDRPDLAQALAPRGTGSAPPLGRAARLLGAAPWEELVFRVGVYGILVLVIARCAQFLGAARQAALVIGELVAILGSAAAFAAFHLEGVQALLREGLRAADAADGAPTAGLDAVFLWRLVAGLLLAGIFRWRGLGTVAWTHGLFNLGLALGAAPNVFL